MRKLKLQVQMSVNGYVGGPNGELDWMTWDSDDKQAKYVTDLTDSCDTILMGRKMTEGFTNYWESVKPDSPEFDFAQRMVNYPKVVFSKSQKAIAGKNVIVENGDLAAAVKKLKDKPGKDIVVYGGATFVSALIKAGLIDEFHLFVNPTAVSKGMTIFGELGKHQKLTLTNSTAFSNGVVVNTYNPVK